MKDILSMLTLDALTFLRPWALWLLLLLIPIALLTLRSHKSDQQWKKAVDPHLLRFLLQQGESSRSYTSAILLLISLALAIVALSGPSFTKQDIPVYRSGDARIILLDLSYSMDAVDIKPTRLTRAKHKVMDMLDMSKEGETGLIVYAGDAFVISPLTSDANTISTMIPVLGSGLMPLVGSEPYLAFEKAIELFENSGKRRGHIIWITDGIEDTDAELIIDTIKGSPYTLGILAVGTEQGAPIPLPGDKGFLKSDGEIVMPALRLKPFQQIAQSVGAEFTTLTADNRDIDLVLGTSDASMNDEENASESIEEQQDQGYWLLFLLLPILIFLFRKNAKVPGLALCCLLSTYQVDSYAFSWKDLFLTKDQQAQKALEKGEADKAAELFRDKQWKASAHYRAGNYEQAEALFAEAAKAHQDAQSTDAANPNETSQSGRISKADDWYNKGNALAHQQKFDEAIEAYNNALAIEPDMDDAIFNKKLLEELKKQQEQQEQENDQQNSDDQQNQQQEEQQQQDQQSEEENSEQQDQEQQEQQQNEQNSEQQQEEKEAKAEDERSEAEKDQALEQWLRKIPDDPGGLLRRKMYREYQKRNRENRNKKKVW